MRAVSSGLANTSNMEPHLKLLLQYLEVCNKVLVANRHRFPYRQIWAAGERALHGEPVVLALYDEVPKARCVVAMGETSISVEPMNENRSRGNLHDLSVHAVSLGYVLEVIAEPDRYVADPSLINWDWLRQ